MRKLKTDINKKLDNILKIINAEQSDYSWQ